MKERITHGPEETRALGAALGNILQPGDLVCLEGELGAGKTTFVQGIANGWGSADQVTSPTFVLVNAYRRHDGQRLYHMDAYRLGNAAEAEDLDLDAMLATAPLVVEWADRIQDALPDFTFKIRIFDLGLDERKFLIKADTPHRLKRLIHLDTASMNRRN